MTSFYENADNGPGDIDYTSAIEDALLAAQAAQAAAELAQSSATTSATAATTQAGNASTSATNASNSASSASASAIAAGLAKDASEAAQVASEAARDEVQGAISTLETFPADAAGVLTNDGAGNLSWGAGGGSFDPSSNETITGTWSFDNSVTIDDAVIGDNGAVTEYPFLPLIQLNGITKGVYSTDIGGEWIHLLSLTQNEVDPLIGSSVGCLDVTSGSPTQLATVDTSIASGVATVSVTSMGTMANNIAFSTATAASQSISFSTDGNGLAFDISSNGTDRSIALYSNGDDGIINISSSSQLQLNTGSGTSKGLSATVGSNTTLFGKEGHSTLGDYWVMKAGSAGTLCPNMILNKDVSGTGAMVKLGIGTSTVYGLELTRTSGNLITEKLYTPNGSIVLYQDTDNTNAFVELNTNGSGTATVNGSAILTESSNITSGSYTPTIVVMSGYFTAAGVISYYQRIGNIVSVSAYVHLTATTVASTASIRLTLPVSSSFSASTDLTGVYSAFETTTPRRGNGHVYAHVANDQLECDMVLDSGVGSGDVVYVAINAQYIVI